MQAFSKNDQATGQRFYQLGWKTWSFERSSSEASRSLGFEGIMRSILLKGTSKNPNPYCTWLNIE
jgi:hypothetical protein